MIVSPDDLVHRLRHQYFGDERTTHADLQVKRHNGSVSVSGTVLDRPAAELLLGGLTSHAPSVDWRDEMTPLVTGPDYSWALTARAVSDVRREATHRSERVSQVIYGEPLEVLRRVGNWAYVRLQDGYLGWTQTEPLHVCTAEAAREWISGTTDIVRQPLLPCYANQSGDPHQQVMLLPFGARLHVEGVDGPYRKVRCPDNAVRWVPGTGLLPAEEIAHTGIEGLRTIVSWAQAVTGVPYLWGGKTPFGYDCSGLIQILYGLLGLHLRRDADQQFTQGRAVPFDEIEFGDCLFFDTSASEEHLQSGGGEVQVTHVALALDHGEFLHASRTHGGVVRNSFEPHAPHGIPAYRLRFLGARRYI